MGDLINEILARLRLMIADFPTVTVWNNQFEYIYNGENYSYLLPALFVEVLNEENMDISGGFQSSDVTVRVHIGQNVFNTAQIDENLTIFSLRDLVVKSLSRFKPTTAGQMIKVSERQDFDHSNVYHYEIDFKMQWVDNTAVPIEYYTTPVTNPIDVVPSPITITPTLT